jgi:hypothetical protein
MEEREQELMEEIAREAPHFTVPHCLNCEMSIYKTEQGYECKRCNLTVSNKVQEGSAKALLRAGLLAYRRRLGI